MSLIDAFRFPRILACLCLLASATPAPAEEFCATNSLEIDDALTAAAVNGEDDVVKIAAGSYDVGIVSLEYAPAELPNGDDNDLTLIGGYSEFFGNPCGQRLVDDPFMTVLDAEGLRRVLRIAAPEHGSVTIRLLTFTGGNPPAGSYGGGLEITAVDGARGTLTIERNVFVDNQARYGGGLSATSGAGGFGPLRVINNLFVNNHSPLNGNIAAANLSNLDDQGFTADSIWFTNNTVVSNTADTTESFATGGAQLYGPVGRYVFNNNLWNNTGADLNVYAPGGDDHDYQLVSNNFAARIGAEPTNAMNNLSVPPVYEGGGFFDYTPVRSSPLVDAGIDPPPISTSWYLTPYDLHPRDRVIGPAVDIGAYENDRIFANGFELLL